MGQDGIGQDATEQEWFETNRRMWDERVPIHVKGPFYDVDAFLAGSEVLRDFELEEVGDVAGKTLVHPQCHFGLDTLAWARRGATVTGLDFSRPAIDAARDIAKQAGIEARFEVGNVYDSAATLGQRFDIVYTGLGALCWLPDLGRWADQMTSLVCAGGMIYVSEFHPLTDMCADEDLTLEHSYFKTEPTTWDETGTYADLEAATDHNRSYEWVHPLSRVIQSLLDRGLRLESFSEHDYTLFPRWPCLRENARKIYRLPEDQPGLPLMYSLRFRADSTS